MSDDTRVKWERLTPDWRAPEDIKPHPHFEEGVSRFGLSLHGEVIDTFVYLAAGDEPVGVKEYSYISSRPLDEAVDPPEIELELPNKWTLQRDRNEGGTHSIFVSTIEGDSLVTIRRPTRNETVEVIMAAVGTIEKTNRSKC